MRNLNKLWRQKQKQHSQNEKPIEIIGVGQSLGTYEIAQQIPKRITSVKCISLTGVLYKISQRMYLNSMQNEQHLKIFKKEANLKQNWRKNHMKTLKLSTNIDSIQNSNPSTA